MIGVRLGAMEQCSIGAPFETVLPEALFSDTSHQASSKNVHILHIYCTKKYANTQHLKDPTCAIFSKCVGFNDIKHDIICAVQKIKKLSETPGTVPIVAKLCMIDCKNRKIAEKLVQPVTPHFGCF